MAGIDDLDFEGLVEGAFSDEDDTARFDSRQLLRPKSRKPLRTPVLSGRKMASESSHHLPLIDPDGPETVEERIDTSRLDPSSNDFRRIYEKAGLDRSEFTIFKLAELFEDDELAELDEDARRAAVRAILKSHGVELGEIMDDAVARRDALEAQEQKMRDGVNSLAESLKEENAQLQAEIEEFANPRLARMEANDQRAEQARQRYRAWVQNKQEELTRINGIVEPWGGDDRLRVTEKVAALQDNATTVPTQSVQANQGQSVSHEEIFEGTHDFEPASEADLQELEELSSPSSPSEEWSFGETSEGLDEPSVQTDLGSYSAAAAADDVTASESFEFERLRNRFLPLTPLQGLVAGIASILWIFAGGLLASQLTRVIAPAAIGIALGGPVVLALILVAVAKASNKRFHFFTGLLLGSIIAFGAAHHDPSKLLETFEDRPVWVVDEAGLDARVEEPFHRLFSAYVDVFAEQLGIEAPAEPKPRESAGE